jgi:hypothetical protein
MARFTETAILDAVDYELFGQLLQKIQEQDRSVNTSSAISYFWNAESPYLCLQKENFRPSLRYDISFRTSVQDESKITFADSLNAILVKELKMVSRRKVSEDNWSFNAIEAQLFIAMAKVYSLLNTGKLPLNGSFNQASILSDGLHKDSKQANINKSLEDHLNKFIAAIFET